MNIAEKIIDKFGGIAALSKLLGHTNCSTVQGWKKRGLVPAHQQQVVLDLARDNGVELRPDDFFKPPPSDGET